MTLVDLIVACAMACVYGGAVQALVARRSIGGYLITPASALVGAVLGSYLARALGLPDPLTLASGGRAIPLVWASVGATLAAVVAAWLQRPRLAVGRHRVGIPDAALVLVEPTGGIGTGASVGLPTTGQWRRFEGEARRRWTRVTDADWRRAGESLAALASRIQERHGVPLETVTRQLRLLMFRSRDRVAVGVS